MDMAGYNTVSLYSEIFINMNEKIKELCKFVLSLGHTPSCAKYGYVPTSDICTCHREKYKKIAEEILEKHTDN